VETLQTLLKCVFILPVVVSGAFAFLSGAGSALTKIDVGIAGSAARLRNSSSSLSALQHVQGATVDNQLCEMKVRNVA